MPLGLEVEMVCPSWLTRKTLPVNLFWILGGFLFVGWNFFLWFGCFFVFFGVFWFFFVFFNMMTNNLDSCA